MKLRHFFTINLFFAVFFGLACALFPRWVFQLYGLPSDEAAVWVGRLIGGSILGYATLMGFGRRSATVEARKAIALAMFVQDAISSIASVELLLTGKSNAFCWLSLALYILLTLGYAYFLFIRTKDI